MVKETSVSTKAINDNFEPFVNKIYKRLVKGAEEYGDGSFLRKPSELAGEAEEELLDICGWSFVLYCRMKALREALDNKQR